MYNKLSYSINIKTWQLLPVLLLVCEDEQQSSILLSQEKPPSGEEPPSGEAPPLGENSTHRGCTSLGRRLHFCTSALILPLVSTS